MIAEPKHVASDDARLRHACAELARRLRAGETKVVEHLAAADPELWADGETALELIYREFTVRAELGQNTDRQEYFNRFPAWRDRLARIFDLHALAAANLVGTGPSFSDSTVVSQSAGAPAALATGRPVGNYILLEEIGRGGMGVVYKAQQGGLNRIVALKMILAGAHASPAQRARFQEEAQAAAHLEHPNIVRTHEVGEHDGLAFLSMEFVPGGNLEQLLEARSSRGCAGLPPESAARLVETLAQAVQYAHEQSIIHRDLKPANILLHKSGLKEPEIRGQKSEISDRRTEISGRQPEDGSRVSSDLCSLISDLWPKITDFGLAKTLDAGEGATRSGMLLGTPRYMAPEQAAGGAAVGPALDVHALGVILYELLTGRPPFEGASVEETLEQVRTAEPIAPRQLRPQAPRDLETICLKCLQKDPARRYHTAQALAADLRRYLAGEPILARPTSVGERSLKWIKRRPAVATLLASIILVTAGALATISWQWRQTVDALADKELARQDEEKQRKKLEAALAAKSITLASLEYMRGKLENAKQLLSECPLEYRNDEWRHVHWACHAEIASVAVPRHQDEPLQIVCSPDGQRFAAFHSAFFNQSLTVHDLRDGKTMFTIGPILTGIDKAAFSSDGRRLVIVSCGKRDLKFAKLQRRTVFVWDVAEAQPLSEYELPFNDFQWAFLSANAERLAWCLPIMNPKRQITVWDANAGKELRKITVDRMLGMHCPPVFSPDGRLVAAASASTNVKSVFVWDVANAALVHALREELFVYRLAFAADGAQLAWFSKPLYLARNPGTPRVTIWNLRDNRQTAVLQVADEIHDLAFSPDGRRLALAENDRSITLWDVASAVPIVTLRGHAETLTSVAFAPNGERLVSASKDGVVKIWNALPPDR